MVFVRTAKTEVISTFLVEDFQKNVTKRQVLFWKNVTGRV